MNEEIKGLEERLRTVEGHIKMLLGGAAALSVCALAFLGIEYWRVPRAVQAAVGERIDQTTLQRISEANTLAENLIKNAGGNNQWDSAKQSGWMLLGDTLICYGTASLQYRDTKHTCPFDFAFPKQFDASPTISQSIRVDDRSGHGYTYGVYRSALTSTGYAGALTEIQGRDFSAPVTMSYVAIGKPK